MYLYYTIINLLGFIYQQSKFNYNPLTSPIQIIFANYRDILCTETLYNIYYRARNPQRIRVIFTQETYPNDDDCFDKAFNGPLSSTKFKSWLGENVSVIRKSASNARGLHANVYQAQLLLREEGFALKIDSHSDFLQNYDYKYIESFNLNSDENAIFSNQALNWSYRPDLQNNYNPSYVAISCELKFIQNGIFLLRTYEFITPSNYTCFQTKLACKNSQIVASNIFGRAHFMKNVPYDKYMDFLFFGEEPLYALRLYTHGYNIYLPYYNFVFHFVSTDKSKREKFPAKRNFDEGAYYRSLQRFRKLLGLAYDEKNYEGKEIEKFGIGRERTVEEYFDFIGIKNYEEFFGNIGDKNSIRREPCDMFNEWNKIKSSISG